MLFKHTRRTTPAAIRHARKTSFQDGYLYGHADGYAQAQAELRSRNRALTQALENRPNHYQGAQETVKAADLYERYLRTGEVPE